MILRCEKDFPFKIMFGRNPGRMYNYVIENPCYTPYTSAGSKILYCFDCFNQCLRTLTVFKSKIRQTLNLPSHPPSLKLLFLSTTLTDQRNHH